MIDFGALVASRMDQIAKMVRFSEKFIREHTDPLEVYAQSQMLSDEELWQHFLHGEKVYQHQLPNGVYFWRAGENDEIVHFGIGAGDRPYVLNCFVRGHRTARTERYYNALNDEFFRLQRIAIDRVNRLDAEAKLRGLAGRPFRLGRSQIGYLKSSPANAIGFPQSLWVVRLPLPPLTLIMASRLECEFIRFGRERKFPLWNVSKGNSDDEVIAGIKERKAKGWSFLISPSLFAGRQPTESEEPDYDRATAGWTLANDGTWTQHAHFPKHHLSALIMPWAKTPEPRL